MSKLTKPELEKAVVDAVKKEYPGAVDIVPSEIGVNTAEGMAMYADFNRPADKPADAKKGRLQADFCYVMVLSDGNAVLFDDGEELVRYFQNLLDRKRSLLQRFTELNFNDFIGAFIAFAIVGTFAFLIIHAALEPTPPEDWISKEFLAIVSVVLGFYFGRNPKSKE